MQFSIIGSMVVGNKVGDTVGGKQVVLKKEVVKASNIIEVCRHLIYLGKGYRGVTHLEVKPVEEKKEGCPTKTQKTDGDGNESADKNT
jgi:hypothetical protein